MIYMQQPSGIAKISTGIEGLDEVTGGGFPQGRPILICGSAGCGKTLFGIQFLVKGILENDEPGVFVSFEETAADLSHNSASLGFDLNKLSDEGKLRIDHIRVERSEIEETGEYDLEGLFIRLNYAIDAIGAKRVVLDTIESLFSGMQNEGLLRSEIRRLFRWLKEKGVTTVITGERGDTTLTRQGLEEYVSDCVILLDFRVVDQIATRRLRIVKYRGSTHGTNEYPFLIDENGISVIPITSLKLDYGTSSDVISTGLEPLDTLFKKNGIYEGSSTLITGTAGTAKTILAGYFALGSCLRNEPVLIFSFEEAPDQTIRNLNQLLHDHTTLPVTFDDQEPLIPPHSIKDPIGLYCGWYSLRNYVPPGPFAPGAVGFHIASLELVSLHGRAERGWVHGLLSDGACATVGPVAEPYLQSFPPADEFFPLLLSGSGMARDGKVPIAAGIWAADVLFAIGVIVLSWRLIRR